MKKVIDEKKMFKSEIMVRKEVNNEIQRSISLIKYELQSFIEKNIWEGSKKGKSYWLRADGLKLFLTMNPMEKLKNTMNKTSENMTYLIDNKKFPCQNNKLHLLTSRRVKWISETLYRQITSIVKNDSPNCITPEGGEDLLHQELTNCGD